MAKKLLCVIISVLMVVAMLPVGAFADETVTETYAYDSTGESGFTLSNYWGSTVSDNTVTFNGSQWAETYVNLPSSVDVSTVTSMTCTFSGVSGTAQLKIYYADGTEGYPGSFSADGTVSVTFSGELSKFTIQDPVGSSATSVTLESVTLTMTATEAGDDDNDEPDEDDSEVDTSFQIEGQSISSSGWGYSYADGTITYEYGWAGCGWWFGTDSTLQLDTLTITTGNEIASQVVIEYMSTYDYTDDNGDTKTAHYYKTVAAVDGVISATDINVAPDGCEDTNIIQIYIQAQNDAGKLTVSSVTYTLASAGTGDEEGSDDGETTTPTDVDTSAWTIGVIGYDINNNSTWSGVESEGLSFSVTVSDLFDAAQISSVSNFGGMLIQIWNLSDDAEGVEVYYTISINDKEVINTSSTITVSEYSAYQIAQFNTASFIYAGSETYTFNADDVITITVTVPTTSGGETETTTSSATRAYGLIYVNEEYHGFLIMRDGTRHLACVPHTVDANGYCTVCKEYIGVDGDVATTEINGGEYVEAYSEDILFTSSGWGTYDLGDTALIDALATEGSILVITRDRETSITFDDNSYEKFGLVDSWWSGDWIQLGTGGHTDADEESATIIDCISDDGVSVMYDGNTIYDAWVAAGMSNGGTATLITNTSGLYQITNVTVYVPAGSTTVEEVEVTEPQESTDTETEEDGTDDVDVSETDTTDTADVAESNPTTGVVIALVPMAIAGLAVVASKRR